MRTSEGIFLCAECPLREPDDAHDSNGPYVGTEDGYISVGLEFMNADQAAASGVPVQKFRTSFVDPEGKKSPPFFGGTDIEDIASCDKPVSHRYGVLGLRKRLGCAAFESNLPDWAKAQR